MVRCKQKCVLLKQRFNKSKLQVGKFYCTEARKQKMSLLVAMAFTHILSCIVAILSWNAFAHAISCPNPNYCDTREVKYMAFSALNEIYLNSTDHVISSLPIKDQNDCKRECVRTSGCQSSNHFQLINPSVMMCDLIAGNRWSNASKLIPKKNSTHFFIQSPCASFPCKNGGTCTSLDQEAKFKCDCRDSNHTVRFEGKYCQTVKVAEEAAQVYYNFDQKDPIDLRSTTNQKLTATSSFVLFTLQVPERMSSVLYIPARQKHYIGTSYSECITNINACTPGNGPYLDNDGLSVSFWYRILKRALIHNRHCSGQWNAITSSQTTSSYYGMEVRMNGCPTNAISVTIRDQTLLYQVAWGSALNAIEHWSHFMFTFSASKGIVMFSNGIEVAAKVTPTKSFDIAASQSNFLRFGKTDHGDLQMYIDDFAAWYYRLLPEEVEMIYDRGLKRNQRQSWNTV